MNPNEFEVVTAIGMLYFDEQHCDIVCLEAVSYTHLDVYKRQEAAFQRPVKTFDECLRAY